MGAAAQDEPGAPAGPLRNRVTPLGALEAVAARGLFMGNRGRLHDESRRIVRATWTTRSWVCCALRFKERRRVPMTPGHYTELFFLDEATALAAGHRPCAECRRNAFRAFANAFARSRGERKAPRAAELDLALHDERTGRRGRRRVWRSGSCRLPSGAMVAIDGAKGIWLVIEDRLLQWGHSGYMASRPRGEGMDVTVITPRSSVAALAHGYVPALHPTALAVPASV